VLGRAVHEVEVVAGVEQVAGAAGTQSKPSQCTALDDGVDVLLLFLFGVGVVEAQVAHAAVVRARPKFRQMLLAWPMCR
jgi:hypothetical protein